MRPDAHSSGDEITRLLKESCDGSETARDALLSAVHGELLAMARGRMRGERVDHTLGATALLHEAYLRLFRSLSSDGTSPDWTNRASFYAAAATAMRRILVDHARGRARLKRGSTPGASRRVSLDVLEAARSTDPGTVLALDEAIDRLAGIDARAAEVVRLRFFAGLEQAEIGELLGCNERTVKRDWTFARAWLHDALSHESPPNAEHTMGINWNNVKETLSDALDIERDRRAAFLDQRCGTDRSLRDTVVRLIDEHESSTGFLDDESLSPRRAVRAPAPTRVGPYEVHEPLGEGGFGVVYRATQRSPFEREVAIKVLKPHLNAAAVAERFRTERDALARMDHADICRVLDAGITPEGSPFVVMELVRGAPIGDYCTARTLSARQRAALVARAARAIHHAHQRAILHCDVKPSNILVSDDREPGARDSTRLRVIDFGIARALDATGAPTRGELVGTPRFMSPERRHDAHVADVRSDVFSLGAVLADLLDGAEPMRRVTMRELRAIASKATATAPEARYDSAAALADDIDRALRAEPVLAMPGGAAYRLNRFVARHRTASALATVAMLAVVVGVALALTSRHDALVARDAARHEELRAEFVSSFLLDDMLGSLDPDVAQGKDVTVLALLDEVERQLERRVGGDPFLLADIAGALGVAYARLGKMPQSAKLLERAVAARAGLEPRDHAKVLGWRIALSQALLHVPERHGEAMSLRARNVADAKKELGSLHPVTMQARLLSFEEPSDWTTRVAELDTMIEAAKSLGPSGDEVIEGALTQKAKIVAALKQTNQQIAILGELVATSEARFGARHSRTISARRQLGTALVDAGETARGVSALNTALSDARAIYAPESATLCGLMFMVATAVARAGETGQALALSRELEAILRQRDGADSAAHAGARRLLGQALVADGDPQAAVPVLESVIPVLRAHWGERHAQVAPALVSLAQAHEALHQDQAALEAADEALTCAKRGSTTALNATRLRIALLAKLGRMAESRAAYDAALAEAANIDDESHLRDLRELGRRYEFAP